MLSLNMRCAAVPRKHLWDKRRAAVSVLMRIVEPLLEVAAYRHDGQREHQIQCAEQQKPAEEVVVRGGDLAHGLGQLDDGDD